MECRRSESNLDRSRESQVSLPLHHCRNFKEFAYTYFKSHGMIMNYFFHMFFLIFFKFPKAISNFSQDTSHASAVLIIRLTVR